MALHWDKRAIIVVRGRKLVDQASKRLNAEEVPHGVFMASHPHYYPERSIQVCSIDTIRSRKVYPKADLVIIDEADQATSPDYHELAAHYEGARFLCVTATPYGSKSLTHVAQKIIHPITVREIIEQGYLVDAKYYAPATPDLKNVRIKGGEYNEKDLEEVMGKSEIVGDVVSCWKKYSPGLPTLVFCVSIAHAQLLCEEFKRVDVRAKVLSAKDPDFIREAVIEELKTGDTEVILNVGIFGRGVDIPWLKTVVLARPTMSLNLHLQQLGRGSRLWEGKDHFLVLDHAGNVLRHGFMDEEHPVDLNGSKKKFKDTEPVHTCEECFGIYRKKQHPNQCPYCGFEEEKKERRNMPDVRSGDLVELDRKNATTKLFLDIERIRSLMLTYFDQLPYMRKPDGYEYSPWWVFHKVKEQLPQISESLISNVFRSEARKRGYSIARKST